MCARGGIAVKIAPSEPRSTGRPSRSEAIILFWIAGQAFAISASAVQEIRTTESMAAGATECSWAGIPTVRHRLGYGKDSIYIVNGCAHFGLNVARPAQVILLRRRRVAVLVDSIDRMEMMTILMRLPSGFRGPERSWYRGITLVAGIVVPVVDPAGFLTEAEIARLDTEAESKFAHGSELSVGAGDRGLENRG